MSQSTAGVRGRAVLAAALLLATVPSLTGLGQLPASAQEPEPAAITDVAGSAFGYYTNVGLFGGARTLRGHGTTVDSTNISYSPSVELPAGGSATAVTEHDPNGAKAQYGPAVIFGGIWPEHVGSAPQSGPLSVSTQGTPEDGSVTSSTDVTLFDPPNANAPGGIGPGPLIADRAQSTCTADASGVSGSATFTNGILETKYDRSTQLAIEFEDIPVNPPPNYTRSGTIDHVGDHYTVVFNEQIIGPDSITVNAAHLYLLGPTARGDMVVGSSTCSLTSTEPNAAPEAGDDALSTDEDEPLTMAAPGLLDNDADPDGDALTATQAQAVFVPGPNEPGRSTDSTYTFPSIPANGSLDMNPDGSLTYTPDPDFNGTDSFDYVARDPRGAHDTGHVTVTVNPVPDPPVARDDAYDTYMDTPLSVPAPGVLADDTDADGDPLTARDASKPANGSVTLNADGSFTYTPRRSFMGTDTFTYVVDDGTGLSDTGLVTINVRRDEAARLKDINPGSGSSVPAEFTQVGDTVFFAATHNGRDLWKTDGTEAGTVLVKDLSSGFGPVSLTQVGDTLFFVLDSFIGAQLWKSDGTDAGTVLVKDVQPGRFFAPHPANLTAVGDTLYFTADNGANGVELWKSDGTEAGTVLVKDINPAGGSSSPANLTVVGDTLFFSANNGANGVELWKSDGTDAGTVLVNDIIPGTGSSFPAFLAQVGGTLLFSATGGVDGRELWRSDGTDAGTVLVKDINSGTGSSFPANFARFGKTLYFTANNGADGVELWETDGTESGTVLVKDINPGSGGSSPAHLTVSGRTLYFSANDGTSGIELWRSDGSDAGTVLVEDINPGSGHSSPANLTVATGLLYFSANDGTYGTELWRSDGTEAGTDLSKDVNPGTGSQGPLGSSPSNLTSALGTVFFSANDGTSGVEPWRLVPGRRAGRG